MTSRNQNLKNDFVLFAHFKMKHISNSIMDIKMKNQNFKKKSLNFECLKQSKVNDFIQ